MVLVNYGDDGGFIRSMECEGSCIVLNPGVSEEVGGKSI